MGFLRRICPSSEAFPIGETSPLLNPQWSSRANYPSLSSARAHPRPGGAPQPLLGKFDTILIPVRLASIPRSLTAFIPGMDSSPNQSGQKVEAPLGRSGALSLNRGHWPPPYHFLSWRYSLTASGSPVGVSLWRFAFRRCSSRVPSSSAIQSWRPDHHWRPFRMQLPCRSREYVDSITCRAAGKAIYRNSGIQTSITTRNHNSQLWHRGQKCVLRPATTTLRIGVPHRRQGSPVRW